jgi:hypothetical protein
MKPCGISRKLTQKERSSSRWSTLVGSSHELLPAWPTETKHVSVKEEEG